MYNNRRYNKSVIEHSIVTIKYYICDILSYLKYNTVLGGYGFTFETIFKRWV